MPKYIIEREISAACNLSPQKLQAISQKSRDALAAIRPQIQWVQSCVTGDEVYCVYIAPNEAAVREHTQQASLPANRISEFRSAVDPTNAEKA